MAVQQVMNTDKQLMLENQDNEEYFTQIIEEQEMCIFEQDKRIGQLEA